MPVFANVLVMYSRSHTLRIVSFDLRYILKMRNSVFITQKIEVSPPPTVTKPKFRTYSLRQIERNSKKTINLKCPWTMLG